METYNFKGKEIVFIISEDGCEKCILANKAGAWCKYSDKTLRKAGIPDCVYGREWNKHGYYAEKK